MEIWCVTKRHTTPISPPPAVANTAAKPGRERRRFGGGTSPTPLTGLARHAQPGSILYATWVNNMSSGRSGPAARSPAIPACVPNIRLVAERVLLAPPTTRGGATAEAASLHSLEIHALDDLEVGVSHFTLEPQ
jgi:hypothetical protein